MANDLERRGKRDLVSYNVTVSEEGRQFTISPFTAVFLKTIWGTDRLTRLTDAHTGLVEAIRRFRTAQIRSENLEQEMREILAIETIERAEVYTTFEHKIARTAMEIDLLTSEQARRTHEHEREIARLQAERREYDQKAQPPPPRKEATAPKRDTDGAGLNDAFGKAWQHLEISRELRKMHRAVDEQVAAGVFGKEEGEQVKEEMEQIIRARLNRARSG